MSVVLSRTAIALIAALSTSPALSQAKPSPWFPVPADASYETGDTWTAGGKRYRLYGVQSCLRGTSFTNAKGVKRDCGEASLAMLVSLVRDLRPMCYAAASVDYGRTVLVFCFATMEQGNNKGSRVDLGTALISIGYAFASVTLDRKPGLLALSHRGDDRRKTRSPGYGRFPICPTRTPSFLRITKPPKPAGPAPAAASSARDEEASINRLLLFGADRARSPFRL